MRRILRRFMKTLADAADKVLPKDEEEDVAARAKGAKGGRPKKEKTLKEALHESWNGKVQRQAGGERAATGGHRGGVGGSRRPRCLRRVVGRHV